MIKRISLGLLLVALLLPLPGTAQTLLVLPEVQVDLWPEYDQPSMLVIYHVRLPDSANLPQTVSLRIPAAVSSPNAVAVRQPDGTLLNAPFDLLNQGRWTQVTVTATLPEIQLEYYDPQLAKDGSDRNFEFTWLSDYDVESLIIQIQQPLGARNFSVTPDLGSLQLGSDGLTYYSMQVGALNADDEIQIEIDYQKETDALTIESFNVQVPEPMDTNTTGRVGLWSVLPWLLGALGVLLLFGGLFWYWQSGFERPARRAPRRSRRAASRSTAETGALAGTVAALDQDEGMIYCHQCGARAAVGDRFCRACGAKLRLD